MATQEQIQTLLGALHRAPPSEHFQKLDKRDMGIRAVLKYLSEVSDHATAGEISKALGVSTARVAVLLKKMVSKGLLEKQSDPTDGRLVVIRLSRLGQDTADRLREEMYAHIGALIDEIGMERLLEFTAISNEIRAVMEKRKKSEQSG